MSQGEVDITIGNGLVGCTHELKFYKVKIRGSGNEIIFIDTQGLDDTDTNNEHSGFKTDE